MLLAAMKFACLDFETANNSDASICAAGIAVFSGGQLEQSRHWLVRPPRPHHYFLFTHIHGITWRDVEGAPEFPVVAAELLPLLQAADVVVAHNASFDLRKLRGTLTHFGMKCPQLSHLCTCQLARRIWADLPNHQLGTLAAHIGHPFKHHNAQEDAEAAGRVLLAMMRHVGVANPMELLARKKEAAVR